MNDSASSAGIGLRLWIPLGLSLENPVSCRFRKACSALSRIRLTPPTNTTFEPLFAVHRFLVQLRHAAVTAVTVSIHNCQTSEKYEKTPFRTRSGGLRLQLLVCLGYAHPPFGGKKWRQGASILYKPLH